MHQRPAETAARDCSRTNRADLLLERIPLQGKDRACPYASAGLVDTHSAIGLLDHLDIVGGHVVETDEIRWASGVGEPTDNAVVPTVHLQPALVRLEPYGRRALPTKSNNNDTCGEDSRGRPGAAATSGLTTPKPVFV